MEELEEEEEKRFVVLLGVFSPHFIVTCGNTIFMLRSLGVKLMLEVLFVGVNVEFRFFFFFGLSILSIIMCFGKSASCAKTLFPFS